MYFYFSNGKTRHADRRLYKSQKEHGLVGKLDNVAKAKGKPDLIKAYDTLFETKVPSS